MNLYYSLTSCLNGIPGCPSFDINNNTDTAFPIIIRGAAAPTVTSISPSAGLAGTSVTLTGTGFTGATEVRFEWSGARQSVAPTVASDTTITVNAPSGFGAGQPRIVVVGPGGQSSGSVTFTYLAVPTLTSLAPASGVVGTPVTLTGSGFTGATAVRFGAASVTPTSFTDTSITVNAPADPKVAVADVTVTGPGGTSAPPKTFTYVPSITSLDKTSGPANTVVTITGTGFYGVRNVTFGGKSVSAFTSSFGTTITAVAPSGLAGAQKVSVVGDGGTSGENVTFTYPSTISTLSALSLSGVTLASPFASVTTAYTAIVANTVTSTTVTATPTDAGATVKVNSAAPAPVNLAVGANAITIEVTAADGVSKTTYTVTVTRAASSVSTLSALSLSGVTLASPFASGTLGYTASVANAVASTTVAATPTDAGASVTVNGSPPGSPVPLAVGANTISIVVTAADGVSKSNYTVTINRSASSVSTLSALSLSGGTLSPAFASGTTAYTANVVNTVTSTVIAATATEAGATIVLQGPAPGPSVPLAVGVNTISIVVTAPDKVSKTTYTITVTRAASSVSTLSALSLGAGTLSPAFASGTTGYTASVANTVTSTIVTATATDAGASITVNGSPPGSAVPLTVGGNTISIVVTAADGVSRTTYTVTVTRAASSVSTLATLSLSAGTLSPAFAPGATAYTASVANTVTSTTVAAAPTDAGASITVNGSPPGSAVPLTIGGNTISIVVTAADGVSRTTYTVTITRAASSVSTLSALSLGAGTLSPAFAPGATAYTANVAHTVSSITISAAPTDAGASVTINGAPAGAAIPLAVGTTPITLAVTAADGVSRTTYTLTVTRAEAPPALAGFSVSVPYASSGVPIDLAAHATGAVTGFALAGAPAHGTAVLAGSVVRYTPARGYSGADAFAVTATGPGGSSAPATIAVTVGPRPDPSKDPQVAGLIQAQVAAQYRLTQAQVSNVVQRLDQLHEDVQEPVSLALSFTSPEGPLTQLEQDRRALLALQDPLRAEAPTRIGRRGMDKDRLFEPARQPVPGRQDPSPFSIWAGGTVAYGSPQRGDGTLPQARFTTDGITLGADYRLAPNVKVGLAGGFGGDTSTIGTGASAETRFGAAMTYASWQAVQGLFVDGMAGYSYSSLNGKRMAADDGSLPRSQRNAQGLFGMVSLTGEQRWGAFHVAPFLRFETTWAQFSAATERGSAFSALSFDAMNTTSAAGVAGLRLGYVFAQDWGRIEPRLRVEYRYQFSGNYSQAMTYADLAGGPSYLLQGSAQSRQEITTMLGLAVDTNSLLSAQIEYGVSLPLTGGSNGVTAQTIRATLRKGF